MEVKKVIWEFGQPQTSWVRITVTYADDKREIEERPMTEKELIFTNRIKKKDLS